MERLRPTPCKGRDGFYGFAEAAGLGTLSSTLATQRAVERSEPRVTVGLPPDVSASAWGRLSFPTYLALFSQKQFEPR